MERGRPAQRRVLFAIAHLEPGGAERVLVTVLEHLSRERFEPHLALVSAHGRLLAEVPRDVHVHDLRAGRLRRAPLRLRRLVAELRPDVVFSTLGYLNLALLALRPWLRRGIPLVVRESIEVSPDLAAARVPSFWRVAYRWLYPLADAIVCPAQTMIDDLATHFGIERARMHLVPNPVDATRIQRALAGATSPYPRPGPNVVALGRLEPQKGFDLLLDAFARAEGRHAGAELWILGEGRERARLLERARALGLHERVNLPGHVPDPYRWIAHARVFVLSSRYEGLPNALLEALACGTRAVAFDAPGGIREAVDGVPGVRLAPREDVAALAGAIDAALAAEGEERPQLPARYELAAVMRRYEELLGSVEASR